MSSEPKLLRELQKEKPSHKWYVYYDVDTGDIVAVTNKEKDFIHHPHLIYINMNRSIVSRIDFEPLQHLEDSLPRRSSRT